MTLIKPYLAYPYSHGFLGDTEMSYTQPVKHPDALPRTIDYVQEVTAHINANEELAVWVRGRFKTQTTGARSRHTLSLQVDLEREVPAWLEEIITDAKERLT